MRSFSVWLTVTLLTFAAASAGYHFYLSDSPRKILVIVDSSFPMRAVWQHVPSALKTICSGRYKTFAVLTEKSRVHSWSPRCELGGVSTYAPRKLSCPTIRKKYPEMDQATDTYLVTNADPAQIEGFCGKIIHPDSR